ncbi:hypothetical protein PFISCL1PPCAC_4820, partial [Pristionchus fissidentatus]
PVRIPPLQACRRTCRSPCMLRSSPFHHVGERPGLRGIVGIKVTSPSILLVPLDPTTLSLPGRHSTSVWLRGSAAARSVHAAAAAAHDIARPGHRPEEVATSATLINR